MPMVPLTTGILTEREGIPLNRNRENMKNVVCDATKGNEKPPIL